MITTTAIAARDWLPVPQLARISATSEDAVHPAVGAFAGPAGPGWKAERLGPNVLTVRFREPLPVGRIRLVFEERDQSRTQEFTLSCTSPDGTRREVVRQQFTFSPGGATRQVEEYAVDADAVAEVTLRIVPDISDGAALASLCECRISARRTVDVGALASGGAGVRSQGVAERMLQAYREMPGLSLTRAQACVLFDLEPDQCDAAVMELGGQGAVRENDRGQIVRAHQLTLDPAM